MKLDPKYSSMSTDVIIRTCDLGFGLFAGRDFRKGEEILSFSGPELSFEAMVEKGPAEANALQIDSTLYLDIGSPGVYANHSCSPNAGIHKDILLIALKTIHAGDEIRYDYSTTMWEDHWTMPCRCGETTCRGVVADFPTLPQDLQQTYLSQGVVQQFIVRRLQDASGDSIEIAPQAA